MNGEAHQKVQAEHLSRNAFLYVRQSTLRQVHENRESTARQYDLKGGRWLWDGSLNRSWSSTVTRDSQEAAPSSGKAFRSWSPRSA